MKAVLFPILPMRLFFLVLFLLAIPVFGQDFRVDNEIHVAGQAAGSEGGVKSVTYFHGDDFLSLIGESGEITFFDAERKTFVLLDPVLRIQTQLSAERSREEADQQRRQKQRHEIPYFAFVARPKFTMEFDETSGKLALQSPWFDYLISTSPMPDADVARRYLDHCDWSCYLNHRINRSLTPLVRLEVDRILREKKLFPHDIAFSYFPKGKGFLAKEEKVRSTHQLIRRLDDRDKQRVDQAREYRRVFLAIPFEEYQEKVAQKNRQ